MVQLCNIYMYINIKKGIKIIARKVLLIWKMLRWNIPPPMHLECDTPVHINIPPYENFSKNKIFYTNAKV
jgi:hypothetical protein